MIIEFIVGLFSSSENAKTVDDAIREVKEISSNSNIGMKDKLKNSGEATIEAMSEAAIDETINQASGLLLNHGDYILGLSEAQKAYAVHIAYLKSINDLGNLSFDELKEYRNAASKALELGIDVADEMNSFWNDFSDAVKEVIGTAADIGARVAATALKVLIL